MYATHSFAKNLRRGTGENIKSLSDERHLVYTTMGPVILLLNFLDINTTHNTEDQLWALLETAMNLPDFVARF
jgi:hypothetical protein